MSWRRLARWRVPLGFVGAALSFWLARPTPLSMAVGLFIALPGEVLRVWAAGHIDKGREITRTGPYRLVRHPLYLGSTILGVGFAVASASVWVALVVAGYLGVMLTAAMRAEEATLDAEFEGEYAAYREGRAAPAERAFGWARVIANREYRAVLGLTIVALFLYWRSGV